MQLHHRAYSLIVSASLASLIIAPGCGSKKTVAATTPAADTTACVAPDPAPAAGVMPACQTEMFAKYKLAGFEAVNAAIIARSVDPNIVASIGDTFQTRIVAASAERQATFTTNLANFLVAAYGGPNNYQGPTMEASHKSLGITTAQYSAFISDVVVPALKASGVEDTDISNCFAPQVTDPNFVANFVTCK